MKNLKLEVGKTYLNRKGERVKIVKDTGHEIFPFDGDNRCCYTPNGGYWTSEKKSHLDLIAEAPPTFRTFKIPENTREISVNETDGRIVIEFVPEVPKFKEGDVVYEDGRVMIVKSYPGSYHANFYARFSRLYIDAQYGIDFTAPTFRLATPAEAQQLFDALAKDGKRWNPDTLKIEELTEREKIKTWLKAAGWWGSEELVSMVEQYVKEREAQQCK